MNFNIREIKEDDLPEIIRWFSNKKWPFPAAPGAGAQIGALAEKNGILYACIFTYITGTAVAYLEWPCLNPDIPKEQSGEAFDELIYHYKRMTEMSEPKIRLLCLTTQSESLAERFKNHGFRVNDGFYRAVWMLKE